MNHDAHRLTLLLAASGFNDRALRKGLEELELHGVDAVIRRVQRLRRSVLTQTLSFTYEEEEGPDVFQSDERRDHFARQVNRLLLDEAHLTASDAAQRLFESFASRQVELPQFRPKDGFFSWIKRVCKEIPPSELLHHATKIRNTILHSGESTAWPLRDREE